MTRHPLLLSWTLLQAEHSWEGEPPAESKAPRWVGVSNTDVICWDGLCQQGPTTTERLPLLTGTPLHSCWAAAHAFSMHWMRMMQMTALQMGLRQLTDKQL